LNNKETYNYLIFNYNYYPFGSVAKGRSFSSSAYRYGFNGQEKDNEVSGEGNSNTAEYWQYDTRLGRRWNLDPEMKEWRGAYTCFSDNPIINIDPLGNTDYYNLKGDKIGSDGINDGGALFVLSRKTERQIIREVQKNGSHVLTAGQQKTTIPVPNEAIINKLDETFTKTESPGNSTEYGFVVGTKEGEQIGSSVTAGSNGSASAPPSYHPSVGAKELGKNGVVAKYSVHSHPNTLRYNGKDGTFSAGDVTASGADKGANNSATYAEIILGEQASNVSNPNDADRKLAQSKPGVWTQRSDTKGRVITFYNQTKTLKVMNYDEFKKIVNKVLQSRPAAPKTDGTK
jgi:RHS repeat-associated protein